MKWRTHYQLVAQLLELAVLLVVVALSSSLVSPQQPVAHAQSLTPINYTDSELLVKFKKPIRQRIKNGNQNDTGMPSVTSVLKRSGAYKFERVGRASKKSRNDSELFGWYIVSLNPKRLKTTEVKNGKTVYPDLESLEAALKNDPNVESVTKNYKVDVQTIPNDPYYSTSGAWGQGIDDLWGLKKINAATAWNTTTGSSSVVVGVVDTGIDRLHADLASNIWTNPGEIAGNGIDDDSNGYIDDIYGWNWCANNNNTLDDHGHGTHVAGTIAAVGNNGSGVVGVSWNAKLMTAKIFCANGSSTLSGIAAALQYVADNGAQISSNSWRGSIADDNIFGDGIKYEYDRGTIPIVGAGNDTADALNYSPAASDGAITVGATDSNDALASFSNRGSRIDVVAPGVDILSLRSSIASTSCIGASIVNTYYCVISGTSMATPHVSGVVALMLSVNPTLNTEQVRQILRTTATDLGTAGRDTMFGSGLINAAAAVSSSGIANVLTPTISNIKSRQSIAGNLQIKGSANGALFANYKVEIGLGRAPSSWTTITSSSSPVTNGVLANFNAASVANGAYIIRVTENSTNSKAYELSVYDVNVVTDATNPSVPTNLTATNITATSQLLNWTESTDNTILAGYDVYRDGALVGSTPTTSYTDTGLSPGVHYVYTVKAYDTTGNRSSASTPLDSPTLTDTTAPSVPTNLTTTNITDTAQRINWNAATDDVLVTGYEIYRDGTLMGTSAVTYFDDTGLSPLTSYTYTIKAFDAAGNTSNASSSLASSTLADTTPPSTPTGLQITGVTMYDQHISWDAATDDIGVISYQIYRDGTPIGTTSSLSFDSTGLRPGILYSYTVRAYDAAANESNDSSTVSGNTVPDSTPPSVSISSPSAGATISGTVSLTSTVTDNDMISQFEVLVDGASVYSGPGALATYNIDTTILTNGDHTLKVTATDASGNATSDAVTVTVDNVPLAKRGDTNGDETVNIFDLSILLSDWGTPSPNSDFDANGIVNIFDLSILLYEFGK